MDHLNNLSKQNFINWIYAVAIVLVPCTSYAQDCSSFIRPTASVGQFRINNNGVVVDKIHKLMWTHCSVGQFTEGQQCIGEAKKFSWKKAVEQAHEIKLAGYTDWRLPTVQELSLLAELSCQQPAINLDLFPSTLGEDYWSITEFINNPDSAWMVHFGYGENHVGSKTTRAHVRYVRTMSDTE